MKSLLYSLAQQFDESWIFMVVKPGFTDLTSDIIHMFEEKGWNLSRIRTKQLTLREAHRLYMVHKDEDFYEKLCRYMASDLSVAIILKKPGKVNKDMFEETGKIKDEIRKKWGKDDMRNVLHSSDSLSAMENEAQIYF